MERLKSMTASSWYQIILGSSLGLFCIAPKAISLCLIFLLIFTIIQAVKGRMIFRFQPLFIAFILFYIAYLIGALFTNHLGDALSYFEKKLSLLIFPILFSFQFKEKIGIKSVAFGLIAGVLVSSIMCLFHSFNYYQLHGDFNNSFGSTIFSYIHHPTYFSAFLIISCIIAIEGYKQKWRFFTCWNVSIFFLFCLIMQFFCFSFAGLIFAFIYLVYLIYNFIFIRFSRTLFLLSILVLPALPWVAYQSNIHVQIIVDEIISDVNRTVSNPESVLNTSSEAYTGNNVRLIMWTVSVQEFLAHPLGAGTANVDDVLGARLRSHKLDSIAIQNYNPHNQYLQIAVEIGVFGLVIFLVLLFSTLRFALKMRNSVLFWIVLSLAFNCLFESMLQRQSGMVFFCFLICFFINQSNFRTKQTTSELT